MVGCRHVCEDRSRLSGSATQVFPTRHCPSQLRRALRSGRPGSWLVPPAKGSSSSVSQPQWIITVSLNIFPSTASGPLTCASKQHTAYHPRGQHLRAPLGSIQGCVQTYQTVKLLVMVFFFCCCWRWLFCLCLFSFCFVNLSQTRIFWEEVTLIEKMPPIVCLKDICVTFS